MHVSSGMKDFRVKGKGSNADNVFSFFCAIEHFWSIFDPSSSFCDFGLIVHLPFFTAEVPITSRVALTSFASIESSPYQPQSLLHL